MAIATREWTDRALELTAKGLASFLGDYLPDDGGRDAQSLLWIITRDQAFADSFSEVERNYAVELLEDAGLSIQEGFAFNEPDAQRVLDTAVRLLQAVGAVREAEEAGAALTEFEALLSRNRPRRVDPASVLLPGTQGIGTEGVSLKPWHQVITPHADIRAGNFNASQFAANLYNVLHGKATPEYADPREFFRRTYLTEGLRNLLERAIRRVSGDMNASPVINLQTNFGGGKTHSMLALYHIFSGTPVADYPEEVRDLIGDVDIQRLGSRVRRVVISGHDLPPQEGVDHDGTHVNTLWGEIAWQLGGQTAFARLAAADESGTNPGREVLEEIVRDAAPCLILVDEWVAYARQLYGKQQLRAGTYDAHFSFVQALLDAVAAVPGAMIAVTIPASDNEVGGINGQRALQRLRGLVRRVGDPWKSATAKESFEIVRRRLFEPVDAAGAADIRAISRQFAVFYRQHLGEFPSEVQLADYEDDIRAAYPIHPELFQRLYDDWSTLERFQRTRGVLTLLSTVIQVLWEVKDPGTMIMPGTLPLGATGVGNQLVQYLDDKWDAVIGKDVEGRESTPAGIDKERPLYGQRSVTERLARTIFIGSAATVRSANKGIERKRVWLGTAVPGDMTPNFDGALHLLAERATYLYTESDRYWYDTTQSVTKTVLDYTDGLLGQPEKVYAEITARLQLQLDRGRSGFAGVDPCPVKTVDIADEDRVRLVVIHPEFTYQRGDQNSTAMEFAREVIRDHGSVARKHPNMLVFLAADGEKTDDLMSAAREYMAWRHVDDHAGDMNLSGFEERLVKDRRRRAAGLFDTLISESYVWTLVPRQPEGNKPPVLTAIQTASVTQNLVERVTDKLTRESLLAFQQAPANIRHVLREKLSAAWRQKGAVTVGELWGFYTRFTFMPRLRDRSVLVNGIRSVLTQNDWESNGFALATGLDGDRFEGLTIPGAGATFGEITDSTLLVMPERALAQLSAHRDMGPAEQLAPDGDWSGDAGDHATSTEQAPVPVVKGPPQHFHGWIKISGDRYGKAFRDLQLEILPHLDGPDSELEITVDIRARRPSGFSDDKQRIVTENAAVLKFEDARFED